MKSKMLKGLALGVALSAFTMTGFAADKPIKIKFGHVISVGDSQDVAYNYFVDLVKEASDGRIIVENYPNSQLGGERELLEAVQAGSLEITAPSVGVVANFDNSFEVFDFPFLFKDKATAYKVLDSDIGDELATRLEDSGFKLIGWGENGFRNLAMKKKVATKPEDAKGVKIRTMQVPLHIAFWKSIGAAPTPVSFPEVFSALQQGVVDGVENPFELLYSAKLTEPASYLAETRHIYDPEPVLMNKAFFDNLSEEDQDIIMDAADKMIEKLRGLKDEARTEAIKNIEESGGTVVQITDEERQMWIDAAIPFYQENASKVDTEMLKRILKAADNDTFLEVVEEIE